MTRTRNTKHLKPKPKPARRFSAVVRVSRRNGREGGSFMSPAEQRRSIKDYCRRHGIEVVGWWDETDSVSGSTTEREGLQGALSEIRAGQSDGIICAKADRFARNVIEGLIAVSELQKAGKAFVAIREGINGDEQSSTPTGRLWLTIILAFAQWQLEALTESWDEAVRNHIANGVARSEPYGYKRDVAPPGATKAEQHGYSRGLRPDKTEARLVKKMFELRAAGASWHTIADEMTKRGVVPPRGGDEWVYGTVRGIVQNRVYLGELRSGEHENLGAHEPIVGEGLWASAQLPPSRTPSREGRETYLLAGLVRCAGCGARMTGKTHGEEYRYYRCRKQFSWGRCAAPAAVAADGLEALVLDRFAAQFLSGDRRISGQPVSAGAGDAEVALRDAKAELRHYLDSPAVKEMRRELGDEYFEVGLQARTSAVSEARERMAAAQGEAVGASLPSGIAEAWGSFTADEKRLVLARVFPVIAVRAEDHRHGRHDERSAVGDKKRTRIFVAGEPGIPADLPGRGGTAKLRPIRWRA
jgi:DNA invertase Pin-like site-specific DNA recombinase